MKGIKSVLSDKPSTNQVIKVNEKNLFAFATSATPKDCEGWLDIKSETSKSFQKRWFILKGNLLFYFEKKGDKEPLGVIILEGCSIELDAGEHKFSFKIVFHCPGGQSYILCADSQDSMEAWMKTLACAGYDYMKLMVSDLEKQLSDIEGNIKEKKNSNISMDEQPRAPPRNTRQNPFNKFSDNASTSTLTYGLNDQEIKNLVTGELSRKSKFWQLHEEYGKMILSDREQWMKRSSKSELLIQFG